MRIESEIVGNRSRDRFESRWKKHFSLSRSLFRTLINWIVNRSQVGKLSDSRQVSSKEGKIRSRNTFTLDRASVRETFDAARTGRNHNKSKQVSAALATISTLCHYSLVSQRESGRHFFPRISIESKRFSIRIYYALVFEIEKRFLSYYIRILRLTRKNACFIIRSKDYCLKTT